MSLKLDCELHIKETMESAKATEEDLKKEDNPTLFAELMNGPPASGDKNVSA